MGVFAKCVSVHAWKLQFINNTPCIYGDELINRLCISVKTGYELFLDFQENYRTI
jgi:hypothetical protein